MSLGRNLKELRQQQSLNQKDLSDRSGVPQATISRIETGRVQPRSSAVKNLADALGVSTDSLMDDNGHSAQVHKNPLHQSLRPSTPLSSTKTDSCTSAARPWPPGWVIARKNC